MAKRKPKVVYRTEPRFRLEPYRGRSSRTTCPACGHKYKFSHFIDVTTGQRVGDDFGRCERVEHCGYLKSPTGGDVKDLSLEVSSNDVLEKYRKKNITNLIDPKFVTRSISADVDNLSAFLLNNFNPKVVNAITRRYRLGSIRKWGGIATVFWQIDKEYDVRTGKFMLYNPETGKRVKEPITYISWAHTPYRDSSFGDNPDFCLTQCFFGEHLLNREYVEEFNVVESEKTALLCSIANPSTYWIATGGIQNINRERMLPFKDKKLIFYPDKGKGYEEWKKKLKPFMEDYNIKVSNAVENMKSLKEGDDIGDYIIQSLAKKQE